MTDHAFELIIPAPGASGPAPVSSWSHTMRLDKIGSVSAEAPGNDPSISLAQVQRSAELMAGIRSFGAGLIEELTKQGKTNGSVEVRFSGPDKLGELNKRIVKNLVIGSESTPLAIASALALIMAFAPSGWTIDTSTYTTTSSTVYFEFAGETVFEALSKVAEAKGEHFRIDGTNKKILWLYKQQPHSGITATRIAGNGPSSDFCLIDGDVEETTSSTDVCTRIYPYGDGTGKKRRTLSGSTWTPPAGYTQNTTDNYIAFTATDSVDIIERQIGYKDIKSGTQLAQACYEELKTRIAPKREYRFRVTHLQKPLFPGMVITLQDRIQLDNGYLALDIDVDLVVLEVTTEINGDGTTADLVVSTSDRWIQQDADMLARRLGSATSMETHDQPVSLATVAETAMTSVAVTDVDVARLSVTQTWAAGQTILVSDAGTNTVVVPLTLAHDTSATAAGSLGLDIQFNAESSTGVMRSQGRIRTQWVAATDATRRSVMRLVVDDWNASRNVINMSADGSQAQIGFMGATAVSRQTLPAAATDAATTQTLANAIRTALINLGLS